MSEKQQKHSDGVEVVYNKARWDLLKTYRQKAQTLLEALHKRSIEAVVHGSVARGDVDRNSDVDAFIPIPPSSFQIETALEQAKIPIAIRTVIQATPAYAMKAYIEIGSETTVSFPLMRLRRVEREFYRFSGEVDLSQINDGTRAAGVDKRLMLIEPTSKGHTENRIIGKEEPTAKMLGIAVQTVQDRVHALMKRDAVGRTGVFVKQQLGPDETFELVLKRLAMENPAVRRRLGVSFF